MALTPQQIDAFNAAIAQLYGATEPLTEDELVVFAQDLLTQVSSQYNEAYAASNNSYLQDFFTLGAITTPGQWNQDTALKLYAVEAIASSGNIDLNPVLAEHPGDAAAETAVVTFAEELGDLNPMELALIRELNDAISGQDTPAIAQAYQMEQAVTQLNAMRDWLNANREELLDLIPDELTDELGGQ